MKSYDVSWWARHRYDEMSWRELTKVERRYDEETWCWIWCDDTWDLTRRYMILDLTCWLILTLMISFCGVFRLLQTRTIIYVWVKIGARDFYFSAFSSLPVATSIPLCHPWHTLSWEFTVERASVRCGQGVIGVAISIRWTRNNVLLSCDLMLIELLYVCESH